MNGLRYQDRQSERSNYSEVVWLIPLKGKRGDFSQAVPAVSKDLSIQGLSLINNDAVSAPELVVGVPGEHGWSFFHCKLEHCSGLGYGFFQIGLFPVKLVTLNTTDNQNWEKRLQEFQAEEPQPEPVG